MCDTQTYTDKQKLICSPPTKANWVQSPAGSLWIFAKWELCLSMLLANMEQHQNVGAGEMVDPRENPPTSGIVWHNFHMQKFGSNPTTHRTHTIGAALRPPPSTLEILYNATTEASQDK
ncbi:hypothetical protein PR048_021678 [Dryococelus australis]|uniref:Uncharacterized protein n=1 Tax=Dryococelus australis TaxID=614101 RepID=A0ABQ9GYV0_9NEOP|nr:hypothetical protein PR048_021678 [Dryococelus australis]